MSTAPAESLSFLSAGMAAEASMVRPGRRADIDGLRAFAAGSVLLFHFFPATFPGGFIGVDIFFVISGFVVTRSMISDLNAGAFSIFDFYGRRIRRLYPAIIVVVLFSILACWAINLGYDYRRAGKDALVALVYLTNMQLAAGTGYFDPSSSSRLFLHFWSLAVEEQFYIVWPLIVALIYRSRNKLTISAIILGASFLVCCLIGSDYPTLSFYALPTRTWQFMVGAIFALSDSKAFDTSPIIGPRLIVARSILSIGGAIAISMACFAYPSDGSYSAWLAIVPTGGAIAIINGQYSNFNRRLLASRFFVWIGHRSYSLYLWHWPILVIYKEYFGDSVSFEASLALMILTMLAAEMTFVYIEGPVRNWGTRRPGSVTSYLLAAQGILIICALLSWRGIIPERLTSLKVYSDAQQDWTEIESLVALNGAKSGKVLFFGDSYVQQIYPRMLENSLRFNGNHKTIIFSTLPGCAPMPEINRRSSKSCLPFVQRSFELAHSSEISDVIIGGSWLGFLNRGDYYRASDASEKPLSFSTSDSDFVFDALELKISSLISEGKRVTLILEWPSNRKANPKMLSKAKSDEDYYISLSEHRERTDKINQKLSEIARRAKASTLNPEHWLCDSSRCSFKAANGRPMFKDGSHLNATYVRENLDAFDRIFTD